MELLDLGCHFWDQISFLCLVGVIQASSFELYVTFMLGKARSMVWGSRSDLRRSIEFVHGMNSPSCS